MERGFMFGPFNPQEGKDHAGRQHWAMAWYDERTRRHRYRIIYGSVREVLRQEEAKGRPVRFLAQAPSGCARCNGDLHFKHERTLAVAHVH